MTAKTATKQAQRTPGPWVVDSYGQTTICNMASKGVRVAACQGFEYAENVANAAFIVRACNSYDDLLAALRAVLDESNIGVTLATKAKARAAITRAEE